MLLRNTQSLAPGETELLERWSSPDSRTMAPRAPVPLRLANHTSSGIHIVPCALPYQKASMSPLAANWLPNTAEAAVSLVDAELMHRAPQLIEHFELGDDLQVQPAQRRPLIAGEIGLVDVAGGLVALLFFAHEAHNGLHAREKNPAVAL